MTETSVVKEISIDKLLTEQDNVHINTVVKYLIMMIFKRDIEPLGVTYCKYHNKLYLDDGNHRVYAAMLLKRRRLKADVEFKCSQEDPAKCPMDYSNYHINIQELRLVKPRILYFHDKEEYMYIRNLKRENKKNQTSLP